MSSETQLSETQLSETQLSETQLSGTQLTGWFLECCDCYTICPCWVQEQPDEDHCSALYVWTFDDDARIEGNPIGGKSIAAAAFHGDRSGSQAAIYVDERLDKPVQQLLLDAFSGKTLASLQGLARLVGAVVDSGSARITHKQDRSGWEVTVEVGNSPLARASGTDAQMPGRAKPLTLDDTALHGRLGLEGAVTVQAVERFEMAVSPLPGGPFVYAGRSGMAARFQYNPG